MLILEKCDLITVHSAYITNLEKSLMYIKFENRNKSKDDTETVFDIVVENTEKYGLVNVGEDIEYSPEEINEMVEEFMSGGIFERLYLGYEKHGKKFVYQVITEFTDVIYVINDKDEVVSYSNSRFEKDILGYEKSSSDMIDIMLKGLMGVEKDIQVRSEIYTTLEYGDTLEVMNVFRDMSGESIFSIVYNLREESIRLVKERVYDLTDEECFKLVEQGLKNINEDIFEEIMRRCNDKFNNQQFEYMYETGKVLVYTEKGED